MPTICLIFLESCEIFMVSRRRFVSVLFSVPDSDTRPCSALKGAGSSSPSSSIDTYRSRLCCYRHGQPVASALSAASLPAAIHSSQADASFKERKSALSLPQMAIFFHRETILTGSISFDVLQSTSTPGDSVKLGRRVSPI